MEYNTGNNNNLRVLFELSNCDSALHNYQPIMCCLREMHENIDIRVVSLCEFYKRRTNTEKLAKVFDKVYVPGEEYQNASVLFRHLFYIFFLLRKLLSTRRYIRRVINTFDPQVVVVANDRKFPEYDLVLIANRLHKPTLLLQESIRKDQAMKKQKRGLRGFVRSVLGYGKLVPHGAGGCKRVAAWGQNGLEYFKAVGVSDDQLFLSGCPRVDSFVEHCCRLDREAVRSGLGIRPETRVVLFATNPVHNMGIMEPVDYISSIRSVIQLVNEIQRDTDTLLLIKPHRSEIQGHDRFGIKDECHTESVQYLVDITLEEAIVVSDVVLVFNSTVALEASLNNKPVALLNLYGSEFGVDFVHRGLAVELQNINDLRNFLMANEQTQRSDTHKAVHHYILNHGRAAQIIAKEIINLSNKVV